MAASLGWMLDAFDVMLYSIVLATLMREFGMGKATAGLLNTLTLVASAIGSLIFGLLADRAGRRRMLSASILLYSIFTFACGFSTSITILAVFRFLLGLGMGGEWNSGATLVAETWPSAWRGRALGIVQSSWAIGYALAAITAHIVLARASWRWVFFVGVLPALITLWIQHDVPEPELWRAQMQQRALSQSEKLSLWRAVLPRLLALLSMNTFGMFAWWGLFTWIPAYLALPVSSGGRNFSQVDFTSFLTILNLCGMLPGYLLFGVFADKFGRKRTIIAYLVLAALSVPAFALAQRPGVILLTASITAFFGTGFFTGSGILGSELFPTPIRATALGVSYNTARGISALAPVLIGAIGEAHGLSWGFSACGIAFAFAAASAVWIPETRGVDLA
ncbi:MAG: MFS transporter [Acidobacteriaceae bacterium]|nr:MFS transporter [Acidobacteriaceae bacterium]MBV9294788.1 MFS transporter [Acidobacteriaceae bacterium]